MNDILIWCEECKYFRSPDMGGEGYCVVYEKHTWYGMHAADCPYFTALKTEEDE